MKKSTKDSIVVGFALFSMFFGAGNLIFPAFLGNTIGDQYLLGIIGFIFTGVGLPLLAIISCSKVDGSFKSIANKVSPKFAVIFTAILFIAIGPMLAIPRTAATTFELSISPFFSGISPFIAMVIYFIINLFFVLGKTSIIDTIGKYLTPTLMIILFILIVKGLIMPIGNVLETNAINVFPNSLLEGYQTMDAIAALLFAGMITTSLKSKGYKDKEMPLMILKSSLIAILGLAFVYGGLTYIGAQTVELASSEISKTALLILISKNILGSIGPVIIGIAMGLACLTTSIGLITSGANFFERISKGKLSFKLNAIIISVLSLGIATLGVDNIVVLSVPILNILYPVSITLIGTTLLSKYINSNKAIRVGVYTSLIFGILFEIPGLNLNFIPLAEIGFGWLIPTILAILFSYIIFTITDNEDQEPEFE
ncbi:MULTISPECIES: branched-chain amino acid transport system II carrier protein [unclassified Clostridium]|jgi:branched-chain amino acid transport system II carrier protein|uniref:branched-chain amino acid transport system II carrier protein n=1 Tax=unclassified Clostridium TaxID=2614128 RepID=UPI0025E3F8DA|nr:branched-chain amino acid transport system II carrier protein [Clostridium sp.]MCI6690942.1 branched-chain amino acid transport system II carrier protein [Clostridium sp.]MDY4252135.1 branched-chain amino acid transport system II carrier protein [Clostridium sp.]